MSLRRRCIGAMAALLSIAALAAAKSPAPAHRAPAQPAAPRETAEDVARVGTRHITRAQFEARAAGAEAAYRQRSGGDVPDAMISIFRREVLESMIRQELVALEAKERGIKASDAEAEAVLRQDAFFNPGGKFDAAKFDAVKAGNSPTYQQAIAELKYQLAGQKYQRLLESENVPSDSLLRAIANRMLVRVSFDYLDIDARLFDGHYREPSERDVLEDYRAHAAQYRRGQRATLSVIFVDRPALPDSLRARPDQVNAWDARLKARADSAIAAIRSGAAFEAMARMYGGARSGVDVIPGNFPGFWQGTKEQSDAVFHSRNGALLPTPVQSNPGYLIVRVDQYAPDHAAPLSEVSPEIRQRLRDQSRLHGDEPDLRALYARAADSLVATAVRVRFATLDTARMEPGEPDEAELDRFYRGHLADYSTFDTHSGTIRAIPLADVRADVRRRWQRDRRAEMAQGRAEDLLRTWSAGRRDQNLEKSATTFRDVGPIPSGNPPDSSIAGQIVADSLDANGSARRASMTPYSRGFVVFQVYDEIPHYRPTYEQALPALRSILDRERAERDRAAAKAWFDHDPGLWSGGRVQHFERFMIQPRDPNEVALTRSEVEHYYRLHFSEYSTPEAVRARHILISPTGPGEAADRVAKARAESVLTVIRGGGNFAEVARAVSDDPATRPRGGDLGSFGRGVMLQPIESAAFAMKPGDVSNLVHTSEGWHILQCTDHTALYAQPLAWIYGNVGYDAARVKADSMAAYTADSLARRVHTPGQAIAAAQQLHLQIEPNEHTIGDLHAAPDVKPYLIKLETVKPGHVYPGAHLLLGMGYAITWVDSISEPSVPDWQQVESRVVDAYVSGAANRVLRQKFAELDSMQHAGWTLDSLATLWGGLGRKHDVLIGTSINEFPGSRTVFDSLLFGARGGRALEKGEISGWALVPGHALRVRLEDRGEPDGAAIAQRMDADRKSSADRAMRTVYGDLATRHRVVILDEELSRTALPAPPPPPPGLP